MLEEAKKIAKPGAEPMWKIQGKKSPRKKEGKKSSSKDKKAQGTMKIKNIHRYFIVKKAHIKRLRSVIKYNFCLFRKTEE